MKNLSISILNVDDISEFLNKLKSVDNAIKKSKVENSIDITIHFDIMDNKFVPNFGIDIDKIKIVKKFGYDVDTHLMVENPVEDKYIDTAIQNGCHDITIHYEIDNFERSFHYLIEKKKIYKDFKIGVSIKPKTDISVLDKYIENIDKILVMSVEPGFGGQKYINEVTEKIDKINKKYKDVFIQVDGGINSDTLKFPLRAGADSVVVGSYLTKDENKLLDNIATLNIIKNIEESPKEADLEFESRTLQIKENGYGQGDIILGIRVPIIRKISKLWYNIVSLDGLDYFIKSNIHDYRRFAIFTLVNKVNLTNKNEIKNFIDNNIKYINNWDLVDSCAPICIGKQLENETDSKIYHILRKYTESEDIWIKRIGIVSLLYLAKKNRKEIVFKVLDDVFYEEFHLFQKASGWVLRELYKVNSKDTLNYLIDKNKRRKIPNILKSYATEKMSKEEKYMLM